MSWLNLNQSLNSLKGQITSFASEVLSEAPAEEAGDTSSTNDEGINVLLENCRKKDIEIAALKKKIEELQSSSQGGIFTPKDEVDSESWNWEKHEKDEQRQSKHPENKENDLQSEIQTLKKQLSTLNESAEEVAKLREDKKNLTTSLEDLDNQHQMAMEKLLSLKKELQKNFEVLKREHEDLKNTNDEYSTELKLLKHKIESQHKEIEFLNTVQSDMATLRHKYQNLERVHSILKESTEKFQEENQDLHEEIFKLQEQITRLEHEIEVTSKNSEFSDMVPRERYEELLKDLNDLRLSEKSVHTLHHDESNIDDNAKGVIENLKREINDLKHKLSLKENEEPNTLDPKFVKTETILYLYDQFVNFELPVDYVWNIPSAGDNTVMYKLEGAFKTLHEFKKDIDALEHALSEKGMNEKRLQEQIDELTTDNDVLSGDVQTYYAELSEMKKNNDFLLSEITTMKNASKLEPIIETHEDNIENLESELADSNKLNVSFQSKIANIEDQLAEVQKEKLYLEENLLDLRDKYDFMSHELEQYKTQMNEVDELQKNERASYLKAEDEIDILKKQLLTSNARGEQLAIDLSVSEKEKLRLTKQIDQVKLELKEKVHAFEEMEQKTIELEKEICDAEKNKAISKNLGLIHTLDLLENEKNLEEMKSSENDNNNTLIEKMTSENNELRTEVTNLNEIIGGYKDRQNRALSEIQLLVDRMEYMNKSLEAKDREIQTLRIHISEYENRINNLQKTSSLQSYEALQNDHEKTTQRLESKIAEIKKLNLAVADEKAEITSLKNDYIKLQDTINKNEDVIKTLNLTIANFNNKEENPILNDYNTVLQEKSALEIKLKERENKVIELRSKVLEAEAAAKQHRQVLDNNDKTIKELNKSLLLATERINSNEARIEAEAKRLMKEKELNYISVIKIKEQALEEAKKILDSIKDENKTYVEKTTKEKKDLYDLVNSKHNESVRFHMEIQRLNSVLLDNANELRSALQENKKLKMDCTKCKELKEALAKKNDAATNFPALSEKCKSLEAELLEAKGTMKALHTKCGELERSIEAQMEITKNITAENAKLAEQEQVSAKELERLRQHLLEQENNHTQELIATEQKLQDSMSRLHQVEERHKQSSTVYTSNSIRANQEVESTRNQMRLIEKQRDDIQLRLSEAEDQNNKCNAALVNLQLVLEQFQRDKDRDVESATVKLQNKITELNRDKDHLSKEIERLNVKLNESIAGLQAATRLGDQLETKTAQINDLKEQVRHLETLVQLADDKYVCAVSNQQDKVDKNLVKNLVLNFVHSENHSNNNRSQVLRVLSTVLDFNQKECERLGLVRPQTTTDSLAMEFVKFLEKESRPAPALPSMQSLTSTPRSASTEPASRKTSVSTTPLPVDHQRHSRNPSNSSNVLLQNMDPGEETTVGLSQVKPVTINPVTINPVLDSGVNQTRNNEGASEVILPEVNSMHILPEASSAPMTIGEGPPTRKSKPPDRLRQDKCTKL